MLSIIVPAFHEPYLRKTIDSLLENATGEIEIIPVLDGWQPESLPSDTRVKPIFLTENKGKRNALNVGFTAASGDFIMSIDAHCIVGLGFDETICDNFEENWLVVPRRYSLNPQTWTRDDSRQIADYHHLSFPVVSPWGFGMYARQWDGKTLSRKASKYDIDDDMTIQGSCWVVNKEYFMKHIYPLDDRSEAYGPLAQDQQELSLKYWLGGGAVKVNKKTWYAHVAKRWYHYSQKVFSRRHKKDEQYIKGNTWGTWHWLNNEEPNMTHQFSWLIEKFWHVPEWPENWQEMLEKVKDETY